MRGLLLLALAACSSRESLPPDASPYDAELRVIEDGTQAVIEMRLTGPAEPGWTRTPPLSQTLTFDPVQPTEQRLGPDLVVTAAYPISATSGSHIIRGACIVLEGQDPLCADPVHLDLGTPTDRSELRDIEDPGRLWPVTEIALGLAGLGLAAYAGVLLLRRRKSAPAEEVAPAAPQTPPEILAIRQWEAARADASLSDHEKALKLSWIFREYTEEVLNFPARAWSTSEIMAHLERIAHLPKGNTPRAKRLLRATDRVKYAEAKPGEDFFEQLDSDLRGFVDSTKPQRWEEPT